VRPSDPAEFDAYHQNYNAAVNSSISFSGLTVDFFTRVKAEYIFSVLATQFDDVSRLDLLDVGCGIGNCHSFFTRKIRTLVGVDVSSDCIVTAAKRNPWVDYRSYDGNRLPFDDSRFDVAFTICVMHHVVPGNGRLLPASCDVSLSPAVLFSFSNIIHTISLRAVLYRAAYLIATRFC